MDRKAFLVPIAVAVAALITDVGTASSSILYRVKPETHETRALSSGEFASTSRPAPNSADEQTLLLHRSSADAVTAQHSSHSSHGSHGSHSSHSSHSSGR